jgi:tetratricopeptide (TPR) repeat protein
MLGRQLVKNATIMEKYALKASKGIAALAIALSAAYASPTFTQDTNPQAETETQKENKKAKENEEGKEDKKDSLADLEKMIKDVKINDGGNWEFHCEMGRQQLTGAQYAEAIAYSHKAHALNKAAPDPLAVIGIAYTENARDKPYDERKAHSEQAIKFLKQALKNKCKEEKESKDKCEKEVEQGMHYTKSDINAWIGIAYHRAGDLEKAVEFYRKAPESMLAKYGLADIEDMH